ncbi:MAG: sigma-70 family RNA polymerase sigma factor [Candidatus Omnitrophica bacterium]|nr:sigma-70 family RNA polymerase sigma factor [Candidatus Omnitrophota bacterium]
MGNSTMSNTIEKVYQSHYDRLYTLAFRMTGSHHDAEDVLQTAFLHALKGWEKFRGESSVYTWLYRIVCNAAKQYRRKAEKLPVEVYAEEQGLAESEVYRHINSYGQVEEKALVEATRETCLQMFMNCMPPKYRAVFTLRCMLHLDVDETARVLEISRESVKTNLHRARKAIRDHMEGRCSLIRPGAPCDCRSFAGYLRATCKEDLALPIITVKTKERQAKKEFETELSDILGIERLYDTRVLPPSFDGFLERVEKKVKEQKKLLRY